MNQQKMLNESTKESTYAYNGILFSHKNEVLIHATTWVNNENMVLSKRRQSQKKFTLHDSIYVKCPE